MWRRCAYWSGVLLIAVAMVTLPSVPIVSSYAGGSALRGSVEDGRYLVNPEHGRPVVEVSEATWRAVYWVERLWPWSAWVPGLTGLLLTGYGRRTNRETARCGWRERKELREVSLVCQTGPTAFPPGRPPVLIGVTPAGRWSALPAWKE